MPRGIVKNPDYLNKDIIVLVKGINAKQTINYIYKGIENINSENIVRASFQNSNVIIYFKNPPKKGGVFFKKNKSDSNVNRSQLKLILSSLIFRWERELNNGNKKIDDALISLHELVNARTSKDITVEELKNPLREILGEISTPPLKKVKIFTTQKSKKLMTQGLNRDALSRFIKMSEVEFKNAIRFIFPPVGGVYFKKEDDTANVESNQLVIKSMQSFIISYLELPLRTIATTQLAKLATEAKNLDAIKIFCEKWAEARKGMKKNSNEGVSAVFGWRESMDTVVVCLNRHLFRPVGASEVYSRVFKSDAVVDPHNLFASPTSPTNLYPQAELRSTVSPLSPATLVAEDSAEKYMQPTLRIVKFTDQNNNFRQHLAFLDSPIAPINVDRNYPTTDTELDGSQDLDYVPSTLSPSIEEKIDSLLPDDVIFSPSVLHGRSSKRTHQNSAEVDGTDSIDRLLEQLAINKPMQSNTSVAIGNNQGPYSIDEELDYLLNQYEQESEHTPEKPDPNAPQSVQNKNQSTVRKASSKLTYVPMPTQQVSSSNPSSSITNATNNSTNNSINNRN